MCPPFIWYIIGVRNIDILWQDAQGMLRDSAHLPSTNNSFVSVDPLFLCTVDPSLD